MMLQKSLSLNNSLQLPSPIKSYTLFGRTIYIKHDDEIHPLISGNKFRKLQTLYKLDSAQLTTIISYGGTQSNAMLSIAALCKLKGWKFIYYTKVLSSQLEENKDSNFALALGLDMEHRAVDNYEENILDLQEKALFFPKNICLVAQGGADSNARKGIEALALEINDKEFNNLHVITPSGTGTTALYLAKSLTCKVLTTACIGNSIYLQEQMRALEDIPLNLRILETEKKYHFAKIKKELYAMYLTCKASGFEIDLLYATVMFKALEENIETIDGDILYIHSGGLLGNSSMLERYRYKNIHI